MSEPCKYEKEIVEMNATLSRIDERTLNLDKRINGSMDAIKTHIEHGRTWRIGIVVALIGLFGQLVFEVLTK